MRKKMKKGLDAKVFRRTAIGTKKDNLRLQSRGGKRY